MAKKSNKPTYNLPACIRNLSRIRKVAGQKEAVRVQVFVHADDDKCTVDCLFAPMGATLNDEWELLGKATISERNKVQFYAGAEILDSILMPLKVKGRIPIALWGIRKGYPVLEDVPV